MSGTAGDTSRMTTPAPTASQTRAKRQVATSATSALSSADLFQQYTNEIKDAKKAHEVLAGRLLVPSNMPPAVGHLLAALLALAQSKPGQAVAVQSLVALHYYAKAAFEAELATGVTEAIATKLDSRVGEAVKKATSETRKHLEGMVKGMQEQVMESSRSMGDAIAGANKLLEEVKGVVADGMVGPASAGEPLISGPKTYAQALRGPAAPQLSPQCARAVTRAQLREKQLLVDGLTTGDGEQLSAAVLVAKAHMALNIMRDEKDFELPEGIKVLAASTLSNGGVIYEFESAGSAAWIKRDGILEEFERGLGVGAQVKPRYYKVVAEYVPVSFEPENPYDLTTVESENDIQHGNLVAARWIKSPEKRTPGQRVAFLLISFLTPQDANRAVAKGLYIASKHVAVRRDQEEPQRCAKCHRYDPPHLARDCKAIHETCANCASIHHRTADCTISSQDDFRCVNCNNERGHAAWEKTCPVYKQALQKLRTRRPEAGFRFFPLAGDPYTWESIDGGEDLFLEDSGRRRRRSPPNQLSRAPPRPAWSQQGSSLLRDYVADALDSIDGTPLSPTDA